MTSNELDRIAERICSELNTKANSHIPRSEQIELIKPILVDEFISVKDKTRRNTLNECVNLLVDLK